MQIRENHLSEQVRTREMKKEYLALGHGTLPEASGRLCDLLFHDRRINKTFVADRARKGVKEAILDYEALRTLSSPIGELSLLRVRLLTGRTHQVRVQLASRSLPLVGDRRYGAPAEGEPLALFACRLTFPHPKTGEKMEFIHDPPQEYPWKPTSHYDFFQNRQCEYFPCHPSGDLDTFSCIFKPLAYRRTGSRCRSQQCN